jgi:antitoxin HicB
MLKYPVVLEPAEEGGYVVRFPDVPKAITQGEDAEEALMRAVDALETALEFYVEHRRPLPVPSKAKAGPVVRPRALTCAKLGVYRTMLERHVGKAELARRLHWHLPQVDRLLDLSHASRVDQIEAAYTALGKEFVVSIADAAPRRAPSRDRGRPRDGGASATVASSGRDRPRSTKRR